MKQCYLKNMSRNHTFCLAKSILAIHSKFFKMALEIIFHFQTIIGTSQLATNVQMIKKKKTHTKKHFFIVSNYFYICRENNYTVFLADIWDLRKFQLALHLLINFFVSIFFLLKSTPHFFLLL